jgi:hypothetical protein
MTLESMFLRFHDLPTQTFLKKTYLELQGLSDLNSKEILEREVQLKIEKKSREAPNGLLEEILGKKFRE